MCGIVGFTGKHQAAPILLDGLSKLEYRGSYAQELMFKNYSGEIWVARKDSP